MSIKSGDYAKRTPHTGQVFQDKAKPAPTKTMEQEAVSNIVINDMPFIDKPTFEYADSPNGMVLEHAGRKEDGIPSSPRANHLKTGLLSRKFALTRDGEEYIKTYSRHDPNDIMGYMEKKGFSSPSLLFPNALSQFSKWQKDHLVNEYVKEDNYNYLITNLKAIKTNIARTILAKVDADRNLSSNFGDFFANSEKWANEDPDIVINEATNRLRQLRLSHREEYKVLVDLYTELNNIDMQQEHYKAKRIKKFTESLQKSIQRSQKKLFGFDSSVDISNELEGVNIQELYQSIGEALIPVPGEEEHIGNRDNIQFDDYIIAKIEFYKRNGETPSPRLISLANMLHGDNEDINLMIMGQKSVSEVESDFNELKEINESLVENSNISMKAATEGVKQILKKTDTSSSFALGVYAKEGVRFDTDSPEFKEWAEKFFGENIDDDELGSLKQSFEDSRNAIRSAVADTVSQAGLLSGDKQSDSEVIKKAQEHFDEIFNKNKDMLKWIYAPEKGTQRYYDTKSAINGAYPFGADDKDANDAAMSALRDMLYLTVMKTRDEEKFDLVFDDDVQRDIVSNGADKDILRLKPDIEDANHAFNAYLYLNKTLSGELEEIEGDKLLESEVFSGTPIDTLSLKKLGKSLAPFAETRFEKEIYPSIPEQELRESIQEMIYLNKGEELTKKLRLDNPGRYFFQNNDVLFRFFTCLEGAKNPTTTVETTGSLAKGCFERMHQGLMQASEKAGQTLDGVKSPMIAANPLGFLVILQMIAADAEKDRIDRLMIQLSRDISEQQSYVNSSKNRLQEAARFINVELGEKGYGGTFVQEGYEGKIARAIEFETIAKDIASTSRDLPKNISLFPESAIGMFADSEKIKASRNRVFAKSVEIFNRRVDEINRIDERIKAELFRHEKLKDESKTLLASIKEIKNKGGVLNDEDIVILSNLEGRLENMEIQAQRTEEKIKDLKREKEELNNIDRNKILDMFKRGELSLEGLTVLEKLELNILLSKYKESLYEEYLDVGKGRTSDSIKNMIEKEVEKIQRVMPILQRDILSSRQIRNDVISGYLYDKYSIQLSDEMKSILKSNTIGESTKINHIGDFIKSEFPNISNEEIKKIMLDVSRIFDTSKTFDSKEKWTLDSEKAQITSEYLSLVNKYKPKLMQAVHDSNNTYAVDGIKRNGMVYVNAGKGLSGYILHKVDKLFKDGRLEEAEYMMESAKKYDIGMGRWMQEHIASKYSDVNDASAAAHAIKRNDVRDKSLLSSRKRRI